MTFGKFFIDVSPFHDTSTLTSTTFSGNGSSVWPGRRIIRIDGASNADLWTSLSHNNDIPFTSIDTSFSSISCSLHHMIIARSTASSSASAMVSVQSISSMPDKSKSSYNELINIKINSINIIFIINPGTCATYSRIYTNHQQTASYKLALALISA